MDKVFIEALEIECTIGIYDWERRIRQPIVLDIEMGFDNRKPATSDAIEDTLDYKAVSKRLIGFVGNSSFGLVETLAERVAARILASPQAVRVFVRIEKLDLGPYALGVEIVRARDQVSPRQAGDRTAQPLVVHLDNAALAAPDLALRLTAWEGQGLPVVLTVGRPDLPRPVTGHGPTQRRIDLLAIEQNAWALAARDARCVVVATRTEIDWAMRQGKTVVWAPSKLVLDAGDGPQGHDPGALAVWLAETLGAARLIVHGDLGLPAGVRVPVIRA